MYGLKVFCFAAVIVCLGNTRFGHASITVEERMAIKEALYPSIVECIDELDLSRDKLVEMLRKGSNADYDPCFVSCLFKKTGFFNDKGMYDYDTAMEFTKPFIKSEETLAKIDKVRKECVKVNDEEVSDGDAGCERAIMLFHCFKEHEHEVNIDE